VELEVRGTPTVVVCTDKFLTLADEQRRTLGAEGLRVVSVPHPVGGLPPAEAEARGRAIADAVIKALTG